MDLERVAAVIRPRSPWEAIDLGFGMVRAWWRPVGTAWLATVAPVWCLLFLLLSGRPGLALFILWWLRPLFDRVPLHVVSRCLFGAPPAPGEVAAELPRLWRRDLLLALTVQRLDPARSFHLPIGQLEGLSGPARKRRRVLLDYSGHSAAVWLTAACSLLELITVVSLFGLINMLSPQDSKLGPAIQAAADGNVPYWLGLVIGALSCVAFLIIEPFYVAAGFSLYLSRRTMLEGWDVEISFRRLAGRLLGRTRGKAAAVLFALAIGGLGAASSFAATPADPAEVIQRVLARPDFRTHQKVSTWRYKNKDNTPPERKRETLNLPHFSLPPGVFRVVAYLLGGALLIFLAVLVLRVALGWLRRPAAAPPGETGALPEAVFGLDIRPESLPADVAGAAWAAWEEGDAAGALGLLYRGALASLVHRDGLEVAASWTEGDCLAVVRRRTAPANADYFGRLTRAWQSTAYAHRPPSRDEAKALCDDWRRHYLDQSRDQSRKEAA